MRVLTIFFCILLLATSSQAVMSVSLHSSNTGISDMQWSVSGNQITIWEDWSSNGLGTVQFDGLPLFADYQITKIVTNNTGVDWTSFSAELLDPNGQTNDFLYDSPTADWVPDGFGHSNDFDGLSFSQGSSTTRTSDAFASTYIDEDLYRDYYSVYGGSVAGNGGTDRLTFSVRNNWFDNDGFLLAQSPNNNMAPVPEPTTMLLFGMGLAGAGIYRRLKK